MKVLHWPRVMQACAKVCYTYKSRDQETAVMQREKHSWNKLLIWPQGVTNKFNTSSRACTRRRHMPCRRYRNRVPINGISAKCAPWTLHTFITIFYLTNCHKCMWEFTHHQICWFTHFQMWSPENADLGQLSMISNFHLTLVQILSSNKQGSRDIRKEYHTSLLQLISAHLLFPRSPCKTHGNLGDWLQTWLPTQDGRQDKGTWSFDLRSLFFPFILVMEH
jgi:hypothetical protein